MKRHHVWNRIAALAFLVVCAGSAPAADVQLEGPEVIKLDWSTQSLRAVDINGDGLNDLVVANNARARIDILLRKSPGKPTPTIGRAATPNRWEPVFDDAAFEKTDYVTGITLSDLVVADVNGDRKPDLVYTGDPDALTLVLQKKDGWAEKKVIDIPAPAKFPGNLLVQDINGDGRVDIVVLGQKELSLLVQRADGSFGQPERYLLTDENIFGLGFADLDADGRSDLFYFVPGSRDPLRVRWQAATPGRFGPEHMYRIETARSSAQVLDSGKGKPPILAYIEQRTGQLGLVQMRRRQTPETGRSLDRPRVFAPRTGGRQGLSYALGDFNGEGFMDIVAADSATAEVYLYLRQKDGTFAPEAAFPSLSDIRAMAAADWDGDKRAELFIASGKEQLVGVSKVGRDGRLSYPEALPGKGRALALAAGSLAPKQPAQVVALRDEAGKRWIDFIGQKEGKPAILHTIDLPAQRGDPKTLRLLDFNQDGRADLAVFTPFEPMRLYVQAQDGTFSEASAAPGFRRGLVDNLEAGRVTTADVDGDGKDEIIVAGSGFARALRLNAAGELEVVDQFNARDPGGEITAALLLPPAKKGGTADFVLYERKQGEFQILQRDTRNVYSFTNAQAAGKIEPVATVLGKAPDGQPEIFILGTDRFWWLPLGEDGWEATKIGGYTTDLNEIKYADVFAADLNGDGRPELVCNDPERNLIEVLGEDGATKWKSVLHFAVFNRDAHVQQKRNSPFEPREMIVADVTGDKRNDLILLVHDRLLIYPQAAGK